MAETRTAHPEMSPLTQAQITWRWRILSSTFMAYAGFYLCRKVFSIAKTSIAKDFDVGLDKVAHIWTAYLVAYMIGQLANSFIGRKWGPRVLLLGGLGISIIINVIFGFTNSYWTFLVFMFFNGLVQACGWPGCVGGVAEWLRRKERGQIMGIWSTNYQIGNMIVKYLGGFLLAYTWRYAFFGCTLAAFAIWWMVWFWQRDKPEDVGLPPIVEKDIDENRSVVASTEVKITFKEYLQILLNPIVPLMGLSYFCLKFLRYALDSWLPSFLNIQGFNVAKAAYYSSIFDWAGIAGVIIAGWALDKIFKGKWAHLCLVMSIGMVIGYALVIKYGANPYLLSICFGLVGFMLYGPDSIICGVASVEVAGERNAIAVAGIINGLGSIGPIIQEEVIGWLVGGKDVAVGMRNVNYLALGMSVAFVLILIVLIIYMNSVQKKLREDMAAG